MAIELDTDNMKHGLLGLAVAIVEIIRDVLKLQALERMESGRLTGDEIERLGRALLEMDAALEEIKLQQGIADTVRAVQDGLDDVVDWIVNPERWVDEM
ncbi:MAG: gas vesicle protein K [Bacillota bacterium]|jgi:hypothetical protein